MDEVFTAFRFVSMECDFRFEKGSVNQDIYFPPMLNHES
jgi:hypothetical protein